MIGGNSSIGEVFEKVVDVRSYAEDSSWVLPNCLIGLELELEGCSSTFMVKNKLWEIKGDNSLRNVNGFDPFELVFSMPLSGKDLTQAVDDLNVINKLKVKPVLSSRTSLHAHLDVRDLTLYQFLKLLISYTVFERSLFKFCGIERENNIFCLPFYKAEGAIFEEFSIPYIISKHIKNLSRESYRYSALNLASLNKFGTVEFRHMGGTWDTTKIRDWVNIIMCLKKYAISDDSTKIKELPTLFSAKGFVQCSKEVFGEYYTSKICNYPDIDTDIMSGIRLAQDIIFKENLNQITLYNTSPIMAQKEDHSEGLKTYSKKKRKTLPAQGALEDPMNAYFRKRPKGEGQLFGWAQPLQAAEQVQEEEPEENA